MEPIVKDWVFEECQNYEIGGFDEYELDQFFNNPSGMAIFAKLPIDFAYLISNLPYSIKNFESDLRMYITTIDKKSTDYENLVKLYYKIKCMQSFVIPYSPYSDSAGIEILRKMPGRAILKLSTPYNQFGYMHLSCKTKKEIKWFVDLWGEPDNHTTMHVAYNDIWHRFERAIRVSQVRKSVESGISIIKAIRLIDRMPVSDSEKDERLLNVALPFGVPYPGFDRREIAQFIRNEAHKAIRGVYGKLHLFLDEVTDENVAKLTSLKYLDVLFAVAGFAAETYKKKSYQHD